MQAAEGALPIQSLSAGFCSQFVAATVFLLDHRHGAQARSAGVGTYRAS